MLATDVSWFGHGKGGTPSSEKQPEAEMQRVELREPRSGCCRHAGNSCCAEEPQALSRAICINSPESGTAQTEAYS